MRIAFYLEEPYPNGMACTKRIHLYAKGLVACGNTVKIIIPKATENSKFVQNKTIEGEFEGVNYQYASNTTVRSSSFLVRRRQDAYGFFKSLRIIKSFKPDIVFMVGNSFSRAISLFLLKQICTWKLVREKSEVPYYKKQSLSNIDKFTLRLIFSLYDGIMVISVTLKEFLQKELNINCRYHIIPILVGNTDKKTESKVSNNIVYTGSLIDHKDGILLLLKAFSKIIKHYPHYRLVMTGNLNNSNDKEKILLAIKEENIESNIEFTGYISEDKLKILTNTAKLLVLAKPKNRQNKYNSATKVGEYLLTGCPVILSTQDTACEVLIDDYDVFMVEPTVNKLAEKLKYVLNNYDEAIKVGAQGRKTALNKFNFIGQTKKLDNFLNSIK